MAATNKYFGQIVFKEHGFSIAAYKRRQLGLRVAVEKASFQWSRFEYDSHLAENVEAAL